MLRDRACTSCECSCGGRGVDNDCKGLSLVSRYDGIDGSTGVADNQ
ncbi:MAG: hypothetical protein ACPGU1_11900 [Myxococcota bacterium]